MNNAALNASTLNSAPLSPFQRIASFIVAAANVIPQPRVWVRGLLDTPLQAAASVTASARLLARAVSNLTAEARFAVNLRSYTGEPVTVNAQAAVLVVGRAVPRTLVGSPVTVPVSVGVQAAARVRTRPQSAVVAQASVVVRDSSRYSQYSPTAFTPAVALVARATSFARVSQPLSWQAVAAFNATPGVGRLRRAHAAIAPTVQFTVVLDIMRNLPYDKDAVAERTILLAQENRVVYVS